MPRTTINNTDYHPAVAGFSQAVQANGAGTFIFVSGLLTERRGVDGQTAWYNDAATVADEGNIEGQTRRIFESLKRILAEARATLDDVVRIVIYLVNKDHYPVVHKVRWEYFGDSPPASTCVQVVRLYDQRQLIEIEATAIVPQPRSG